MGLGDDDRAAPVGGEVQVVGVGDRDRAAVTAGARVDRGQAVAGVVGDPQRAQVPRRGHVLGQGADGEVVDDPGRALVDDVDGVGLRVGHVDARDVAAHLGREHPRARGGVDVERRGAGDDVRAAREARAARGARGRGRRGRRPPAAGRRPPPRRGPRAPSAAAPPRARAPWRDRWPRCRGAGWPRVAAAAQDVEGVAQRRAGRVGQAGREAADDAHAMAAGVDAEDLVARPRPVGAPGDEQAPADRGGGGVAQRVREGGDLARSARPGGRRAPSAAARSSCSRRRRRRSRRSSPRSCPTSPPAGGRRAACARSARPA